MAVHLREANLIDDEAALTALARTYLGGMDSRRFRWLYRENPFGPARAWLAFDGDQEMPIGMAALFPRLGYVGGTEAMGCVLGDFCVSESHRSLGPAIMLQRACLSLIELGQFAFCYDFPSTTMVSVYKYLGLQPTHTSVRMAKLLRTGDKVRQIVPGRLLSGVVSKAADFAIALRDGQPSDPRGVEYRLEEQPCSAEYSRLAERVGSSLGNCTVRGPEYLNWRFREHPSQKYEFLAGYRNGELEAYCVFTLAEDRAEIVDLFGGADHKITTGLLRRLVKLLRSRGAAVVSTSVLASDPRMLLLRNLGFRSRESMPVIGCGAKLSNFGPRLLLMHGDRES
jgi:hypothetical protein